MSEGLISNKEAAVMLGIQPGTLRRWRSEGRGPDWVKMGKGPAARCFYKRRDIQSWIRRNRQQGER